MGLEITVGVNTMADIRSEIDTLLVAKGWTKPSSSLYVSPSTLADKQHVYMSTPISGVSGWLGSQALILRFGNSNNGVDDVIGSPSFGDAQGGDSNAYGAIICDRYAGVGILPSATLKLYYYPSEFMLYGVIISGEYAQHFMFGECDTTIDSPTRITFYNFPLGSYYTSSSLGFPSSAAQTPTNWQGTDYSAYISGVNGNPSPFANSNSGDGFGRQYRSAGVRVGTALSTLLGSGVDNDDSVGWLLTGTPGKDGTLDSATFIKKYDPYARNFHQKYGTAFFMPVIIFNDNINYPNSFLPIATIPNIRHMHLDNFAMGEQFTFGPDTWDSFPCIKKNTAASPGSKMWGVAVFNSVT